MWRFAIALDDLEASCRESERERNLREREPFGTLSLGTVVQAPLPHGRA